MKMNRSARLGLILLVFAFIFVPFLSSCSLTGGKVLSSAGSSGAGAAGAGAAGGGGTSGISPTAGGFGAADANGIEAGAPAI